MFSRCRRFCFPGLRSKIARAQRAFDRIGTQVQARRPRQSLPSVRIGEMQNTTSIGTSRTICPRHFQSETVSNRLRGCTEGRTCGGQGVKDTHSSERRVHSSENGVLSHAQYQTVVELIVDPHATETNAPYHPDHRALTLVNPCWSFPGSHNHHRTRLRVEPVITSHYQDSVSGHN